MPKRTPRRAPPAKRSASRRAKTTKPKPKTKTDRITVSPEELTALYEELEGLRAELARVGNALSARDYELRTALAELEILRLRQTST